MKSVIWVILSSFFHTGFVICSIKVGNMGKCKTRLSFLLPAILLALLPVLAFAAEVRIQNPEDKDDFVSEISLRERPGQSLFLKAGFFQAKEKESGEKEALLEDQRLEASDFLWKVVCPPENSEQGCAEEKFTYTKEGVFFLVPDYLKESESLRIEVSLVPGRGKAKNAVLIVTNAAKEDAAEQEGQELSRRRRIDSAGIAALSPDGADDKQGKSKHRGGRSGGFGGGFSGGGGKSESRKSAKSAESKNRDWAESSFGSSFGDEYDSYGSFGGSGSVGAQQATSARGYNRDNSTPVVACSHVAKAGGGLELRCEEPGKKVLRVRPKVSRKQRAEKNRLQKMEKSRLKQEKKATLPPFRPKAPAKVSSAN